MATAGAYSNECCTTDKDEYDSGDEFDDEAVFTMSEAESSRKSSKEDDNIRETTQL